MRRNLQISQKQANNLMKRTFRYKLEFVRMHRNLRFAILNSHLYSKQKNLFELNYKFNLIIHIHPLCWWNEWMNVRKNPFDELLKCSDFSTVESEARILIFLFWGFFLINKNCDRFFFTFEFFVFFSLFTKQS